MDLLGLSNGLCQHEANFLVLGGRLRPVPKLCLVCVHVEQQGLHSHVDLLCTGPFLDLEELVVVFVEGHAQLSFGAKLV